MNNAAGAGHAADCVQDAGLAVNEDGNADVRALKGVHQQDVAIFGGDVDLSLPFRAASKLLNAFELFGQLSVTDGQGWHLATEALALNVANQAPAVEGRRAGGAEHLRPTNQRQRPVHAHPATSPGLLSRV